MSAAVELLSELARRGIEVRADGERLRYRPRSAMTPDVAERVQAHKPELLALLGHGGAPEAPQGGQSCPRTDAQEPAGRIPGQPDARHELLLAERVESGYVNPGWTPKAWAARLRQLADRCETLRPEVAAQYRAWAKNVVAPVDE